MKEKIEHICYCGKSFIVKKSNIARGWGKFCSLSCSATWRSTKGDLADVFSEANMRKLTKHFYVDGVECKKCNKCEEIKPLDEFHKHTSTSDKLDNRCKVCESKRPKKRKTLTPEEKTNKRLYMRNYLRLKSQTDIQYKIKKRLQGQIRNALRYKTKYQTTLTLLGCSINDFMEHIQSMLPEGIGWEAHGFGPDKFQLDHIIPCDSFDLSIEENQRLCFHYTNLQPLFGYENQRKGVKIPKEEL